MKQNTPLRFLLLLLPFCLLAFLPLTEASAKKPRQLVILHTNDTHSTILPMRANLPDTMLAGRGGFLRRIAMLRQQRQQHPDLLYFDSGDFFQGSAYFTMFKGDVEVGLMNLMGIDAATIGNHEFDFGLDVMAHVFRQANFPIVCANYDFTGTPVEGLVKPWVVIRRNGIKIGVFGLSPKLEGLVSAKNCTGVKYLDPAQVALQTATMLKEQQKCDMVICISHLGWDIKGQDDNYMVSHSRNIDLVLGGHSHTYFQRMEYERNLDGHPVPVDQNGKHALFVGKLTVTLK